jgi:hypothetical protein
MALKTCHSNNTYIRKVEFKLKLVIKDKEGQFILIKGTIYQEEITILNLHVSNVSATNIIKHTLMDLKIQIDSNKVVVEGFNSPLSPIDRSSRQKKSIKKLYN